MKQSLRAASKRIEELEDFNRRCSRDIKAYNTVIDGLIAGNLNPCDWCDDQEDCAPSDQGKGCRNWVLKFDLPDKGDEEKNDGESVTKGVSLEGCTGRA